MTKFDIPLNAHLPDIAKQSPIEDLWEYTALNLLMHWLSPFTAAPPQWAHCHSSGSTRSKLAPLVYLPETRLGCTSALLPVVSFTLRTAPE